MSRTANSADLAGVSMDKLLGYLAVVQETTQKSAESVGTSFQRLFARFGNIKAGKFVDDETGESLNDVAKVLHKFGIELYKGQGQMANVGDVLDTIAGKWDNLTDAERNAIATAAAGTMARENFLVLMENYGTALEYTETATNSAGSAMEKFNTYLQGVEAQLNQIQSSLKQLLVSMGSSDVIRMGISSLQKVLEFLNGDVGQFIIQAATWWLTMKAGTKVFSWFQNSLVATGGKLNSLMFGVKTLIKWMGQLSLKNKSGHLSFKQMANQMANTEKKQEALQLATKKLNEEEAKLTKLVRNNASVTEISNQKEVVAAAVSSKNKAAKEAETAAIQATTAASVALNVALGAASLVVTGVITAVNAVNQKHEDMIDRFKETGEQAKNTRTQLADLISQYKELKENSSLETDNVEQIKTLQEQITELVGGQANGIDLVNGKLEEQIKKLLKINAASSGATEAEARIAGAKISGGSIRPKDERNWWEKVTGGFLQYDLIGASQIAAEQGPLAAIEAIENRITELNQEMSQLSSDDWLKQGYADTLKILQDSLKGYKEELESTASVITEYTLNQYQANNGMIESEEQLNSYVQYLQNQNIVSAKIIPYLKSYVSNLLNIKTEQKDVVESGVQWKDVLQDAGVEASNLTSEIEKLQKQYDALITAYEELNENGYLSYSTFKSLLETGPEYIALLVDENGKLRNNTKIIEDNIRTRIRQQTVEKVNALITENMVNKTDEEVLAYIAKTKAVDKLTDSSLALLRANIANLSVSAQTKQRVWDWAVSIISLTDSINLNTKSTDKATEAKEKLQKQIDGVVAALDEELDRLNKEKDVYDAQQKSLEKALAYANKYIQSKIDALEAQKDALKEANDEQQRQIDLEEAYRNLQKAHQKTMRVYYADTDEWRWEEDPSAVSDAESAVRKAEQAAKEAEIDALIEPWKKYLDYINDITGAYTDIQNLEAFNSQSFLTVSDLDNQNLASAENFRNTYISVQKQLDENIKGSVAYRIKKYTEEKERWEKIPTDYENATKKLIATQSGLIPKENEILSGRAETVKGFASTYKTAMDKVADSAENSAERTGKALENILETEKEFEDFMTSGGTNGVNPNFYSLDFESVKPYATTKSTPKGSAKSEQPKSWFEKFIEGFFKDYNATGYATGTKSSPEGLANVDEKGNELIIDRPAQGRYTFLRDGSGVLPHDLTQRIFALASNPASYFAQAIRSAKSPILNQSNSNDKTTVVNIENVQMPESVTNAGEFVRQLQIMSMNH